jgi:hypothetical protein
MEIIIPTALRILCAVDVLLPRFASRRRWLLSLVLIGGLLVSTFGAPVQIGTAAEPPNKPAARLQIVVKNVKIHDDREGIFSGDGEMRFFVGIWACKPDGPSPCVSSRPSSVPDAMPNSVSNFGEPLSRFGKLFGAGTGDLVVLDAVLPGSGGEMWGAGTSADLGFPVYPGRHYVVQFDMAEEDDDVFTNGEYMGFVYQDISLEDTALGTHTVRSLKEDGSGQGDYTVTYEVRKAPAADLRPGYIKVTPVGGSNKSHVCMSVINSETVAADPFFVALKVDGSVPAGGRVSVGTLGGGEYGESCVDVLLPTSGEHTLTAVVDEVSTVNEYNELNNELAQPYQGTKAAGPEAPDTGTTGSPAPTPAPSGSKIEEIRKPDLAVASIEVNGQQPDGKNGCKDGKNSILVVVKNDGTADARKITVQLAVGGGQGATKLIASLQPGESGEVAFEDVGLKKGQQKLTAIVDPKNAIGEGDDDNNELTVTVACASK